MRLIFTVFMVKIQSVSMYMAAFKGGQVGYLPPLGKVFPSAPRLLGS